MVKLIIRKNEERSGTGNASKYKTDERRQERMLTRRQSHHCDAFPSSPDACPFVTLGWPG